MALNPQPPFPKSRGDTVRSQDWNETVTEVQRLDAAKVNKAGDAITGSLTANAGITVNNQPLTANGGFVVPDNSLSGIKLAPGSVHGSKLQDTTVPGTKLQDNSLPPSKITDSTLPGTKLQDNSMPGTKLQDNSLPASKIADGALPGAKLQDSSVPASKIADNALPGSKLANASTHGAKLQDNSVPGLKLQDNSVNGAKLMYFTQSGTVTVGASAIWRKELNSFPSAPGSILASRTERFLKITKLGFASGFNPPAEVVVDIQYQTVFESPTAGFPNGRIIERALLTNNQSVTVTYWWTMYGIEA